MSRKVSTEQGFSAVEALIVVVVIAVIGVAGWLVWQHHHQQKKAATSSSSTTTQTNKQSSNTQTADPYAGWKSYCDDTYHYCFKYPTDWTLTVQTTPQQQCDAGQVELSSPDSVVQLTYTNDNNHDGALASYTQAVATTALTSTNQSLSVIGGYSQLGSSYYPSYNVVDSSMLSTYPLTIGQETQIPQPPEFTDQGTGTMHCSGSFEAVPSTPLTSLSNAKTWFNTSGAQTALQIFESFRYSTN